MYARLIYFSYFFSLNLWSSLSRCEFIFRVQNAFLTKIAELAWICIFIQRIYYIILVRSEKKYFLYDNLKWTCKLPLLLLCARRLIFSILGIFIHCWEIISFHSFLRSIIITRIITLMRLYCFLFFTEWSQSNVCRRVYPSPLDDW